MRRKHIGKEASKDQTFKIECKSPAWEKQQDVVRHDLMCRAVSCALSWHHASRFLLKASCAAWCHARVCKIHAHHECKRKPCTSQSTFLELEQGCRRAASLNEIGFDFARLCTPARIGSKTERKRRGADMKDGDASSYANTGIVVRSRDMPRHRIVWRATPRTPERHCRGDVVGHNTGRSGSQSPHAAMACVR